MNDRIMQLYQLSKQIHNKLNKVEEYHRKRNVILLFMLLDGLL